MSNWGGCGCGNWWDNFPRSICGSFELPDDAVEDQGQCSPRRVKITCEAPVLPVAQCEDDTYEVIYQPENTDNPFAILATLFDNCCLPITDDNDLPIITIITATSGAPSGACT